MSNASKVFVNGVPEDERPQVLLGSILSCFTSSLMYWSTEALIDLYKGASEMVIEHYQSENRKTKKLEDKLSSALRYAGTERTMILDVIYEEILRYENKGRLTGFGMANRYGDWVPGNPERSM
jgi:allophanate hydrolase subunit 1